ncbi:MAG: SAM-dependent methyltransferase [Flavobacteriales bacterium]|nr:methyltransferase domain-containing protein [Bacteroidales bacterium AH-315-I05]PCJ84665.1 MAG: SAM-dependent methyltransferase [Flavobacteriales bacterium]
MNLDKRLIKDIIRWDVKNWSQCLDYWDLEVGENKKCLELGGAEGGLSLWAALKGNEVVCSDINNPKQKALPLHEKYRVASRISYEAIDATNMPYENEFDVIMFKSVLGGIGRFDKKDQQQKAVNEIHKALKPRGKLLFAENLVGSAFHHFLRNTFVSWGQNWRYIRIEEMKILCQGYAKLRCTSSGFVGAFGKTESQRQVLATLDKWLFNKAVPKNWHYIMFGVAEK